MGVVDIKVLAEYHVMSLVRALQSAAFYYLSCTPWHAFRQKRRHDKGRKRHAEMLRDKPAHSFWVAGITHPDYYKTELALGPTYGSGADRKRGAKLTAKWDAYAAGLPPPGVDLLENTISGLSTTNPPNTDRLMNPPSAAKSKKLALPIDSHTFEKMRGYRRKDEYLWGQGWGVAPEKAHGPSTPACTRHDRMTADIPYPALNHLHPATVTKYNDEQEVAWMMQPPPSAAVMMNFREPTRWDHYHDPQLAPDNPRMVARMDMIRHPLEGMPESNDLGSPYSRTSDNRIDSVGSIVHVTQSDADVLVQTKTRKHHRRSNSAGPRMSGLVVSTDDLSRGASSIPIWTAA